MPTRLHQGDTVLVNLDDHIAATDSDAFPRHDTEDDDNEYRHIHIGVVKYIGFIHGFDMAQYIGVELIESVSFGHSGIVNGYQYFTCSEGHGIHTRIHKVLRKLETSEVAHKMKDIIVMCKTRLSEYVAALSERDAYIEDLKTAQRSLRARLKEAQNGTGNALVENGLSPPQGPQRFTSIESTGSFGSARTDLSHLTLQNNGTTNSVLRLNTIDEFDQSLLRQLRPQDSTKQPMRAHPSFIMGGDSILRGLDIRRQSIEVDPMEMQNGGSQPHNNKNNKHGRRRHRRSVSSNATVVRHMHHHHDVDGDEDDGRDDRHRGRGARGNNEHAPHRRRGRDRDGSGDGQKIRPRSRRHSSMSDIADLSGTSAALKTRYASPYTLARDDSQTRTASHHASKRKAKSSKKKKKRRDRDPHSNKTRSRSRQRDSSDGDDGEDDNAAEEHPSDDEVVVVVERAMHRKHSDHDKKSTAGHGHHGHRSKSAVPEKRKARLAHESKRGQSNKTAVAMPAAGSNNNKQRGQSNQSTRSEAYYHPDAIMQSRSANSSPRHDSSPYHGAMMSPQSLFSPPMSPRMYGVNLSATTQVQSPNNMQATIPSLSQSYSNPMQLAMAAPPLEHPQNAGVNGFRRSAPKQVHFQFQQQQQVMHVNGGPTQTRLPVRKDSHGRSLSWNPVGDHHHHHHHHGGAGGGNGNGGVLSSLSPRGNSNHSASANHLHNPQQQQPHMSMHQPSHSAQVMYHDPSQTTVSNGNSYYNRQPQVDAWVNNGQHAQSPNRRSHK